MQATSNRTAGVRCGIYARVSSAGGRQDTDNQLSQLREYCKRQRYQIIGEYIDHASGKSSDRDAFKRLFGDASKRMFDIVVVWALDRLTREGAFETFAYIRKADRVRCAVRKLHRGAFQDYRSCWRTDAYHSFVDCEVRTDQDIGSN